MLLSVNSVLILFGSLEKPLFLCIVPPCKWNGHIGMLSWGQPTLIYQSLVQVARLNGVFSLLLHIWGSIRAVLSVIVRRYTKLLRFGRYTNPVKVHALTLLRQHGTHYIRSGSVKKACGKAFLRKARHIPRTTYSVVDNETKTRNSANPSATLYQKITGMR